MPRVMFVLLVVMNLLLGCSVRPDMIALESDLQSLVDTFDGRAGVYVRHLETGSEIALNADSLFSTASMVKVPILLKIFDLIDSGELNYHQEMIFKDSLIYNEDDIAGNFQDSARVRLSALVMLMLTMSDNTASLWLQHTAGTGTAINEWLAEQGFEATRVNSRTPGREAGYERFGWGQSTPREMAGLLNLIGDRRAVSPAASDEMYRSLTRSYWNDESLSRIPPWVQAASKQGAVSQAKSEVVLVTAPSGDYLFCVMTDDQADIGYEIDNAGFELLRTVSELLWTTFEPNSDWRPAVGYERFVGPDQ